MTSSEGATLRESGFPAVNKTSVTPLASVLGAARGPGHRDGQDVCPEPHPRQQDRPRRGPRLRKVAGLPVLVHLRRDFLACDKALRAQIAQPAVRSFGVVMLSPILNDDAGFA